MVKRKSTSRWAANLRTLMEAKGFNPRALSLAAGLNPTAVRDMLEGRTQFPRYDTVEALAGVLNVTPVQLMGGTPETLGESAVPETTDDDLDILTEIIARLQEMVVAGQHTLSAEEFAAMVATIYGQMPRAQQEKDAARPGVAARLHDLMTYEGLRRSRKG